MKKITISVMVLLGLSLSSSALSQEVLRIGTMGTYEPWNFINEYGQLDGFDIEVAKEVCQLESLRCEFTAQSWDTVVSSLRFNKFHLLASGLYRTHARERVFVFGDNYAVPRSQFFILAGSDLENACASGCDEKLNYEEVDESSNATVQRLKSNLAGKKVAVLTRSAQSHFVQSRFPEAQIVEVGSVEAIHEMLRNGKVDIGFTGSSRISALQKKSSKFKGIPVKFNGQELGKGVAFIFSLKNKNLVPQFNDGINQLKASGRLKELSIKWFGEDITE